MVLFFQQLSVYLFIRNVLCQQVYRSLKIIGGYCDYFFKPPNIGGGLEGVDVFLLLFLRQKK